MALSIKVENLSKSYMISHMEQDNFKTLRDSLARSASNLSNRLLHPLSKKGRKKGKEEFWALRDISFDLEQGDRLGVIGRNGAGKSTLLKILSRITMPTAGRAVVRGRVVSLLEVGTGFHPELTGRENIYLNGAILGMRKAEIKKKFDEIVEFSGIERFLDTPVKRFSSGMYVRLAFSVAAHIEPDILIVDEVLAVGDISFRKKCLGKISDIAGEGRTILFVSHQLAAVQNLCKKVLVLQDGKQVFKGSAQEGINYYTNMMDSLSDQKLEHRTDRKGDQRIKILGVRFLDGVSGRPLGLVVSGQSVEIEIQYYAEEENMEADISIGMFSQEGMLYFACRSSIVNANLVTQKGKGYWRCKIDKWPLSGGQYRYNIYCEGNGYLADWIVDAGKIIVENGDYYGTGKIPAPKASSVFIEYQWEQ